MAKNPVFPLYYNDIDRSTRDWTDEEFGAYLRLLMHQWDKGFLPKSYQRLTRIATSLDTTWELLKDKFEETDGVLKNMVLEAIRDKTLKHKEKQKNNVLKRYQTNYQNSTKNLPLEDEYENEIDNCIKDDKVIKSKMPLAKDFNELPENIEGSVIELLYITQKTKATKEDISGLWNVFKIQNLTGKKFYENNEAVYSHFINWSKTQKIAQNGQQSTGSSPNTVTKHNAGALELLRKGKEEFAVLRRKQDGGA